MMKRRNIAQRDLQQQTNQTKQLSSTDLTQFAHGEERNTPMREGFYFRHRRPLL